MREERSRLVPLPGSRLRQTGMWGLSAGGVGGLGLDALSFLITSRGSDVRILLSAGLCLVSAALVVIGSLLDRVLRRKYEGGGASR